MIAVLSTMASFPRRPSDQQAAAEMRQAEAWVLADVTRPLSLAALCRDIALPRLALASACRTTFGRPLLVHLRELRLYQLQWALEDGLWFDLDTALRSAAYRNRGQFLDDFKALFGHVPELWELERDLFGRLIARFSRSLTVADF